MEDEELEKTCFSVFPTCYVKKRLKIHLFLVNLSFFGCVLDIYVSINGNNLKLKVKS